MMFVPIEGSQKKFKKPNILRKKVKACIPKSNMLESSECMDIVKTFCESSAENDTGKHKSELIPFGDDPLMSINSNDAIDNNEMSNEKNKTLNLTNIENKTDVKSGENTNEALVNIEAFFNNSQGENMMLYDIDFKPGKQIETLVVIEDESPRNGMLIEKNSDLITSMVPVSAVTSQFGGQNETIVPTPVANIYTLPTTLPKYKCDAPNCKKEFRSEKKLKKHKNVHNEDGSVKPSRQVTVECPVKKIKADGTEAACGRIFLVRELLLKHLNEDHTPDDACYTCEECGRRFFWSSGLRAHARSHWRSTEAVLRCGWPGCDRVFRQPCRLREHARAHTGDRPYPCDYPECGWSFRSASKLLRHARRHTGERRHVCAACGRAFLRSEHLREHTARHHAARPHHACTHPGCELTFSNMSTLYLHMKRVHKNKEVGAPETITTELPSLESRSEDTFLVNLPTEEEEVEPEPVDADVGELETETETEADVEIGGTWRAARTHCTWPLRPTPAVAPATLHDHFTVEQSEENSENNIYTVRSDLFLHGNVLINEDSQQSSAVVPAGDALDNDLGLLDAHPTVDLMQEELLYTEAGDESSFRIFLLSGEDLT